MLSRPVDYYTGILYLHNDIFLTGIIGYDWLKFNLYPQNEILDMPPFSPCYREL